MENQDDPLKSSEAFRNYIKHEIFKGSLTFMMTEKVNPFVN